MISNKLQFRYVYFLTFSKHLMKFFGYNRFKFVWLQKRLFLVELYLLGRPSY